MAAACIEVGFKFTIMCLLLWGISAQRNKDELIQDTVRKFLGVKSDDKSSPPGKTHSLPPRYMMDLYEKYRSGQTPMQGNTVRSILAMKDKIDGVDMLIFNLTSLKATEHILQSKIYLLKRRKPRGEKKKQVTFRLNVGCLPGMASKHQIEITLGRQKSEWHSYDISESVVSCRRNRKGSDSLLGLTLEIKRSKGSFRMVAFKRLVKPNSQPFVLIFSEDSQNQTASTSTSKNQDIHGEIGDLLRAKANAEGVLPEKYHLPQSSDANHQREKRSVKDIIHLYRNVGIKFDSSSDISVQKYFHTVIKSYDINKNSRCELIKVLRTFIDNIRGTFSVNRHYNHAQQTKLTSTIQGKDISYNAVPTKTHHLNVKNGGTSKKVLFLNTVQKYSEQIVNNTQILTLQNRTKRAISDKLRYSTEEKEPRNSETTVNTIQAIDENHLQSSDKFHRGRRRNQKKKVRQSTKRHKKKRRRNRKLPFWWTKHDSRLHAQDMKLLCKRKSLMVDFSQLGWDDWIISPKSFNAHFCEGSCSFPTIKHTETSNHAAIQSLIHAMGLNTNVPTPSCVPTTLSSLTLLYFDEYGGLVLKSYPNMIVEKCGCR